MHDSSDSKIKFTRCKKWRWSAELEHYPVVPWYVRSSHPSIYGSAWNVLFRVHRPIYRHSLCWQGGVIGRPNSSTRGTRTSDPTFMTKCYIAEFNLNWARKQKAEMRKRFKNVHLLTPVGGIINARRCSQFNFGVSGITWTTLFKNWVNDQKACSTQQCTDCIKLSA